MKNAFFLIIALSAMAIVYRFGVLGGGTVVMVCAFLGRAVVDRIEYSRNIDRYRIMYDDIIVISRNPEDDEELDLPKELLSVVVWADYEDVTKEVNNQKKWLREAGNNFFVDESLKEHEKIQVHKLIFQDGEFINETWSEEFRERAIAFIKNKRAIRHGLLKETDPVYYDMVGNRQKGVAWSPKKT